MIRPPSWIALLATAALVAACGGPSAPDHQGGGAVMIEPRPDAMESPGRLEFADLSLHIEAEDDEVLEPYIKGKVLGGLFEPTEDVVGVMSGPPARRRTTKGWLELRTRSFFPDTAERMPRPPFVLGHQDKETGAFYPTSGLRLEGPSLPTLPAEFDEADLVPPDAEAPTDDEAGTPRGG